MKLRNNREDVQYLKRLADNRLSLRPIAIRYQHLISWAEAVLDEANPSVATMERRERVVVRDAGGKK